MKRSIFRVLPAGIMLLLGTLTGSASALPDAIDNSTLLPTTAVSMSGLHVVGNKIENGAGQKIFFHGANRSGTEIDCIRGSNYTLGISGQSFVNTLKSWNINLVRVPLNEDCWLGVNTNASNAAYMGAAYRQAIVNYVNLLTSSSNNLAVILDLHWSAPGTTPSTGQVPMPDADHATTFWSSVASTFAGNSSVIFDLFNEPYPNFTYVAESSSLAWQCWLNGGTACSDPAINYTTVGMQSLVNTVRSTGAHNVIMVGGLQYANELSLWLSYKPTDPLSNLAASWHMYAPANFCSNQSCWNTYVAPVIAKVPVITGEFGSSPNELGLCDASSLYSLWNFLESKQQGYSAWVFRVYGGTCQSGFAWSLISDESGTPTPYGWIYRTHLFGKPSTYPALLGN
jgi:aryl-phospho-beta-D-glucosidase BglC (GH1 family)